MNDATRLHVDGAIEDCVACYAGPNAYRFGRERRHLSGEEHANAVRRSDSRTA